MNRHRLCMFVAALAGALVLTAGFDADAQGRGRRGGRGPGAAADPEWQRERATWKLNHLDENVKALGRAGHLRPAELERFRRMHGRAVARVERVFSDGQVTVDEADQLRRLHWHLRRYVQAIVDRVGIDAWRTACGQSCPWGGPGGGWGGRGGGWGGGRGRGGGGGAGPGGGFGAGRGGGAGPGAGAAGSGPPADVPPPEDPSWEQIP